MERIHIELNNPNRCYFAGQIVDGRVVVYSKETEKVLEITIELVGAGQVHWTKEESYTECVTEIVNGKTRTKPVTRTRTVPYAAEETYMSDKCSIAGNGQSSIMLPKGIVAYPFHFTLPSDLPSSYISHTGKVSYILKGEIRKGILRSNYSTQLPFTVCGIFDLNFEAGTSLPQECRETKGTNFCACRSGQLGYVLSLPRSGFLPGRGIDFRVQITNRSNQKIFLTKASLKRITTFHAQGSTSYIRELICSIQGPSVDEGEYELWEDVLMIPAVPPTRLGGVCRLIDLEYSLHFEMRISGPSNPLTGTLPVIIGTIPFSNISDDNMYSSVAGILMSPREGAMSSNSHSVMGFSPNDSNKEPIPPTSRQANFTGKYSNTPETTALPTHSDVVVGNNSANFIHDPSELPPHIRRMHERMQKKVDIMKRKDSGVD